MGISLKQCDMGVVPASRFEATRQRLGELLGSKPDLDGHKTNFAAYCRRTGPMKHGPPVFGGVNCAPPLTLQELRKVGFRCTHQIEPGWAYIIPRRCWHFVRNAKPVPRCGRTGQFTADDDPSNTAEHAVASAACGDSFAWDLQLAAYD